MGATPRVRQAPVAALGLAGCAVVMLLRAPAAQQAAQQPAQPTFRTGINTVRVDAVVSDHSGRPLTDLTKEDFEVTEKGKRQTITNFKLEMLDGGLLTGPNEGVTTISSDEVEQEEAAKDDVRLFTLFLDDYHVSEESTRIVREQLSRWVETQLGPTDMVGVMYPLTPLAGIRMTRNREITIKAIQQFEGRRGNYTPRNPIEEGYVKWNGLQPEEIEVVRREVVYSALRAIATHMGGLKQGRQTLIFVSEGFEENRFVKRPMFSSGKRWDTDLLAMEDIAAVANRNHTAIYAIDPRIYPPGTQWMPSNTMDTLSFLANNTGGRAIFDQTQTGSELRDRYKTYELPTSGLALAMKQMMIDASVYYLLGYESSVPADDKFHEIGVKVKRRGVEVRHRQGYFATRPPSR
ncbi:MAG TPA: VWA domain-containing protein [Vicinamibacterales bacterium]|jgi:VWFA-related protein|nr:VWA domain-containing protein [Vicinamibacterales bacterium]